MTGQASWLRAICYAVMMLAGLTGPARAQSPSDPGPHLAMRLVAETDHPRAGSSVTLALDTRPAPGWHGYWRNPGDAGFPATFKWTLPAGVGAGEFAYPVPSTLLIAGLMNYVYERPYAPLVELRVPAGLAAGTRLPVRLHTDYLVCTASVCVPEQSDLSTELTVGDGAPTRSAAFDVWRRAIPKPLGATATWAVDKGARIAIAYPASAPLADAYFFPLTTGAIDLAAPQTVTRDGDRLLITTKAGQGARGALDGVLRIGAGRGLAVHASYGATSERATGWSAVLAAFALAVLGGVVLNVMPCVFPILSLKALSLARSGTSAAHARGEALAYSAGVIAVVVALGATILLLRAGGTSVGWAFQLQSPRVVLVLLLLTAGIAFNLAGLFELPTPSIGNLADKGGAFATGALAAVIATPCTGPFMGAALGAALVLPWFAALAIFFGLGLGLALPFLAIGFVPALRRRLPRPGAWMVVARRVLSVPMFLTAIALAWVLKQETGPNAVIFAVFVTGCLAMVLWGIGLTQRKGGAIGKVYLIGLGLILVSAMASPQVDTPPIRKPLSAAAQPFSEARLSSLRAAKRPVFAYFTADWCFTCKVNEKAAIETDGARAAFARRNVAVLVGDWTDGDPALGRFLEAHGRAGVPLYLYYAPGAAEARVLPQTLTPGMLEGLAAFHLPTFFVTPDLFRGPTAQPWLRDVSAHLRPRDRSAAKVDPGSQSVSTRGRLGPGTSPG